jgi:uncharacterized RDD family membrane protein YckC
MYDTVAAVVELRPATQGKRFGNLIIDSIVTQVLSFVAGAVLGVIYAINKAQQGVEFTAADEGFLNTIGFFVGIAVNLVYYIAMEALFQKTLGKLVTGTRVVNAEGGKPSFGQVVGRSFARLIPFEAFSFFGGQGRPVGWHDSLAKTFVIESR